MVKGIQSEHIASTVKHFALNNKETNRRDSDSRVSERAAREIYLKALQMIVEQADPWWTYGDHYKEVKEGTMRKWHVVFRNVLWRHGEKESSAERI